MKVLSVAVLLSVLLASCGPDMTAINRATQRAEHSAQRAEVAARTAERAASLASEAAEKTAAADSPDGVDTEGSARWWAMKATDTTDRMESVCGSCERVEQLNKLRKLAIVGWLLMIPPKFKNGSINLNAPLRDWTILMTYSSANQCLHNAQSEAWNASKTGKNPVEQERRNYPSRVLKKTGILVDAFSASQVFSFW